MHFCMCVYVHVHVHVCACVCTTPGEQEIYGARPLRPKDLQGRASSGGVREMCATEPP